MWYTLGDAGFLSSTVAWTWISAAMGLADPGSAVCYCKGLNNSQYFGSQIPSIATVPCTSNLPQIDVGNYLGPYLTFPNWTYLSLSPAEMLASWSSAEGAHKEAS